MKRIAVSVLILFFSISAFAKGGSGKLTVKYNFTKIEEGYDHDSKIVVYVDGRKAGESKVQPESRPGSYQLTITPGQHEIKIEAWAQYQGNWELHIKDNNYSTDQVVEKDMNIGKNSKLTIEFNLDDGPIVK